MIWDDLATGVSYCFVGKVWQHETLKIPNFSKWERGLAPLSSSQPTSAPPGAREETLW